MAQEVAKKSSTEPIKTAQSDAEVELSKALSTFLRGYSSSSSEDTLNIVDGRYKIDVNVPLPDFNTKTATAYLARDIDTPNKDFVAMVCDPNTLQRTNIIRPLINSPHPNIINLIASDIVPLDRTQDERMVIIYEKPKGAKLSQLISSSKTRPNFEYICQYIIAPIALAIKHLSDIGVAHGNINCDNIYFDTKSTLGAVLGQCVAEPAGYTQPFYYEPLERMQAMPAGKGEGDSTQDYYALAVVILHVLYGMNHFSVFSQEALVRAVLKEGAFNALTRQKDMSEVFYDFFRGLLSQSSSDRWSYKYLKAWLDGKRYNVMPSPPPQEAIRPLDFANSHAYTRREVANLFATHWELVPEVFTSGQLSTWVANSLRNRELNEYLTRTAKSTLALSRKNDPTVNEHIMRTIAVFDPLGPARIGTLSFHLDGINSLFAELIIKKLDEDMHMLMQFIDMSMYHTVAEQKNKEIKHEDGEINNITPILTKLDQIRGIIKNENIGFGIERILYNLNPNMRCLSPKLSGKYVTNLRALLKVLDTLAPKMMDSDPIDRHIAAFIASQLNIQHSINIPMLAAQPNIANHPSIIALKLFADAQRKTEMHYLPGLTNLLGLRILSLLDAIRSRTLKRKLTIMLGNAARSGNLMKMAEIIIDSGYAQAEATAYQQAVRKFKQNAADIIYYQKKEMIEIHSKMLGARMAHYIGMTALMFSFYIAIRGS